jgi:hypothetical protein
MRADRHRLQSLGSGRAQSRPCAAAAWVAKSVAVTSDYLRSYDYLRNQLIIHFITKTVPPIKTDRYGRYPNLRPREFPDRDRNRWRYLSKESQRAGFLPG